MKFHAVANLFPMLEGDAFEQLKADIAAHGQHQPIWTYQGEIIDGRNRFLACQAIKVEPTFREWDGNGSLVEFAVSLNLHRRHLTSGQRATVAVEVEALLAKEAKDRQRASGGDKKSELAKLAKSVVQLVEQPILNGKSAVQAATLTGTNHQYVINAKRVKAEAPELFERVKTGSMTLPQAMKEVKQQGKANEPPPRQIGPKLSAADEDSRKFSQLRDKLCDRWITDYDKAAMKQCFRQLANEV